MDRILSEAVAPGVGSPRSGLGCALLGATLPFDQAAGERCVTVDGGADHRPRQETPLKTPMMAPSDAERIDQVVARIKDRLPAAQQPALEAFVRRYYADVDAEDLAERSADDLYGAALSHWHFARAVRRRPGASCGCSTRASTNTAGSPRTR